MMASTARIIGYSTPSRRGKAPGMRGDDDEFIVVRSGFGLDRHLGEVEIGPARMHIASWSLTSLPQLGHWRRTSSRSDAVGSAVRSPITGTTKPMMNQSEERATPDPADEAGRDPNQIATSR